MGNLLSRPGPGIMLAATAVGVSHLVFSTQDSGRFVLSLALVIVAIVGFALVVQLSDPLDLIERPRCTCFLDIQSHLRGRERVCV